MEDLPVERNFDIAWRKLTESGAAEYGEDTLNDDVHAAHQAAGPYLQQLPAGVHPALPFRQPGK